MEYDDNAGYLRAAVSHTSGQLINNPVERSPICLSAFNAVLGMELMCESSVLDDISWLNSDTSSALRVNVPCLFGVFVAYPRIRFSTIVSRRRSPVTMIGEAGVLSRFCAVGFCVLPVVISRLSHCLRLVLKCERRGESMRRVLWISLSMSLFIPTVLFVPSALLVPMSIIRISAGLRVPIPATCRKVSRSVLVPPQFVTSRFLSCISPCVISFMCNTLAHSSSPLAMFNAWAEKYNLRVSGSSGPVSGMVLHSLSDLFLDAIHSLRVVAPFTISITAKKIFDGYSYIPASLTWAIELPRSRFAFFFASAFALLMSASFSGLQTFTACWMPRVLCVARNITPFAPSSLSGSSSKRRRSHPG